MKFLIENIQIYASKNIKKLRKKTTLNSEKKLRILILKKIFFQFFPISPGYKISFYAIYTLCLVKRIIRVKKSCQFPIMFINRNKKNFKAFLSEKTTMKVRLNISNFRENASKKEKILKIFSFFLLLLKIFKLRLFRL